MAPYSPFLRPLGIAAGILGTFQAITWGILSLLGILLYTGDIGVRSFHFNLDRFQWTLVHMYFVPNTIVGDFMTPGTVVVWTSIYFGTSVIWLVISGFLLYDSCKSKLTYNIIIGWVAVTAVMAAIDFAGTVAFGVDYDTLKSEIGKVTFPIQYATEILLAPIFMMTMCARGFILWIMNVGLVIYLSVAARKLYKMGSQPVRFA